MKKLLFWFSIIILAIAVLCSISHIASKYCFSFLPRVDVYWIFTLAGVGILAGFISSMLKKKINLFLN